MYVPNVLSPWFPTPKLPLERSGRHSPMVHVLSELYSSSLAGAYILGLVWCYWLTNIACVLCSIIRGRRWSGEIFCCFSLSHSSPLGYANWCQLCCWHHMFLTSREHLSAEEGLRWWMLTPPHPLHVMSQSLPSSSALAELHWHLSYDWVMLA